jgi:hypothetical protein
MSTLLKKIQKVQFTPGRPGLSIFDRARREPELFSELRRKKILRRLTAKKPSNNVLKGHIRAEQRQKNYMPKAKCCQCLYRRAGLLIVHINGLSKVIETQFKMEEDSRL